MHTILKQLKALSALPSPPQVALKIVEATRDLDKGSSELAEVLRTDPAISAKVLQISNSTAYARSREITTLSDAINLLGTKSLSVIALGFSLQQSIPSFNVKDLDQNILWKHAVATGVVARTLSRVLGKTNDEVAFTCGLLARIGQLVFLSAMPDRYSTVIEKSNKRLPTAREEFKELGVTHHEVASLLLRQWELPVTIREVVQYWEEEECCPDNADLKQLANVVYVADAARAVLFDDDKGASLERLHALAQERCGLAPTEVDRIFVTCQNELRETLAIFVEQQDEVSCETILAMARDQIVNMSVQLVTDLTSMNERCEELSNSVDELHEQSTTDGLTGLSNRFALDAELKKLDAAYDTTKRNPYSIVMLDIDNFKQLNDNYGHNVGDMVLQAVGGALSGSARATDFVARYGGEEFTVILPNCDQQQAVAVAERFRQAVGCKEFELPDGRFSVTASAGVASTNSCLAGQSNCEILKCADKALYLAKRNGRNRTVQYEREFETHGSLPPSCNRARRKQLVE